MRTASSTAYLVLGGAAVWWLVSVALDAAPSWLLLLVPMLLFALLFAVMGLVNLWLLAHAALERRRARPTGLADLTPRQAWWLYVKMWAVAAMGISLCVTAHWMFGLLSDTLRQLVPWLAPVFYAFCLMLTAAAMLSIMRGHDLHEVRLLGAETENQLLKSQLNPHFLYNTLNNIDALVWIDSARASEALTSLSDAMRYMTYSARRQYVTVGEEQKHIEHLVALQRLRMTTPGALTFEASVDNPRADVAPLLLMPLVENSFKHCSTPDAPGAIVLRLSTCGGVLDFSTDNAYDAARRDDRPHGMGLDVMRRRLSLLYPAASRLEVKADPVAGRFAVHLRVRMERG